MTQSDIMARLGDDLASYFGEEPHEYGCTIKKDVESGKRPTAADRFTAPNTQAPATRKTETNGGECNG